MVEVLEKKSTDEDTLMATITKEEDCWMTPFIRYLIDGTLPEDKLQARRFRMRTPMYHFKDGILYRKSFIDPYLRCVGPTQAKEIIQEMHEGAYSTHSGYRTIISRIKRMGYFWPHMYRDTYDLIVNCETYRQKKCLLAFIGRRIPLEEPSRIMRLSGQIIDSPVLPYKHLDHAHA
ncbi:uncharacterized protein [Rutidosis leptorrhynchoides]|uniref:uncharacterized protein n=1 Tax=Rutidosis leptorrhynchoides TaxID=125765 RepID=UPI003A99706B